jgi:AraC-like DNA-binding protein
MKTRVLIPHPALKPYIQNYLYFEVGTKNVWTRADTSPTALPVMSFVMNTDKFLFKEFGSREPLMFGGQITEYTQMHVFGKLKMFYVFFRPAGAYQLINIPQKELKGTIFNMRDLLGAEARILREKLSEQTSLASVLKIIETFFLHRLFQQKKNEAAFLLASAVSQVEKYSYQSNVIKNVCRQFGYSISRLERHMSQMVGIGPKMLQRIVRFNEVLKYLNQQKPPYHWTGIANRFGYFDQTHFIKDFAWFYGYTPNNLGMLASKLQLSLNCFGEEDSGKSLLRVYE